MKKTLNINIGNSIIHIAEDAYEILTAYLNEIKQHFSNNADDFEIVTDIENRIAEMLTEMLHSQQKPVIDQADVQMVIAQMGRVQDFETTGEEVEAEPQQEGFAAFTQTKRLFRDTDDGMIAGVCAGLAHYLNVEIIWIRLAALLTVFLGGSGMLAYIILWIAMPRAITRAEKMAMKGEATNLQGFKRNFDEELAAFKTNMKNANDQLQPFVKRSGGLIAEIIEHLGHFLQGTGKQIIKILAGCIAVIGLGFLLALIVSLVAFIGFLDGHAYQNFPLNIINENYQSILVFAVFILVFIPLLSLVMFSSRVAFNTRPTNKILSYTFLIIWLGGVVFTVYLVTRTSLEFREKAELTLVKEIKSYPTYTLTANRTRFFTHDDSLKYNINSQQKEQRIILSNFHEEFDMPKNVRIRIERSDNDKTSITQNYSSHGKTFEQALKNAQNIQYKYLQQDSLLNFNTQLLLLQKTNWRGQEVRITLRVPLGTHLIINEEIANYLEGHDLWACQDYNNDNEIRTSEWVMTNEGLQCKHEIQKSDEE